MDITRKYDIIRIYINTYGGMIMIKDAMWIGAPRGIGGVCPEFFKSIRVHAGIKKATLCVTAIGVYEAAVNGRRVGDFVLAPGCTAFRERLQYQEYDVTDMLDEESEISITVGTGWFRGRISSKYGDIHDTPCGAIAELMIRYDDGTEEVIRTDESWSVRKSRILFSDIYDGEVYDASGSFEEWSGAVTYPDISKNTLIYQQGEIVCEHERIKPAAVLKAPDGKTIIDFGQNIAGYVEFSVDAEDGDEVKFSCAEVLDKNGDIYTENYRSAKSEIKYICRKGVQTYKPHFTFSGFRYIKLDNYPCSVEPDNFTAVALYSNMERTGYMRCQNAKVNKLYENTLWSQRGNFIDVPTDCPQRDERMGWTGDAQVFVKTASYNYDVKKFFEKWLCDVRAEQFENGAVPDTVPNFWSLKGSSAAWGDVICVVPWQIYMTYGDKRVLEDNFDAMRKWVDFITADTKEEFLWTSSDEDKALWKKHYGDWLALDAPYGSYKGTTDDDFIASAFYAYSTSLVVKAGEVIGRDVAKYRYLYDNIVRKFKQRYSKPKTQTEHVLLLYFDLTDDKAGTAAALNRMIVENGNKLQTGFVGTPYLLHALSDNGYAQTAYSLLLQEEYPSWLYEVNHGATTIWEHWDGIRDDGTFWSSDMNSYNHYAYGSVIGWIYEKAAGIKPVEEAPGYERVIIEPVADERLGSLDVSYMTKHGTIRSSWRYENGRARYEISVPCRALVRVNGSEYDVEKGDHIF